MAMPCQRESNFCPAGRSVKRVPAQVVGNKAVSIREWNPKPEAFRLETTMKPSASLGVQANSEGGDGMTAQLRNAPSSTSLLRRYDAIVIGAGFPGSISCTDYATSWA